MQTFAQNTSCHLYIQVLFLPPMRPILTLLLFLAAATAAFAQTYTGKIIAVKDGDTFEMLVSGKKLRIRLFGIDAPEHGQPFGTQAKQHASRLCFGKQVKAIQRQKDRYGRIVADVYLEDGRWVNHLLVFAGYAWHYKHYSKDPALAKAAQAARSGKRGLWKDAAPTAPWEWRKRKIRV